MNYTAGPALLLTIVLQGWGAEHNGFEPGSLSDSRIKGAAIAAGFQVKDIKADIPAVVCSQMSFVTPGYDDPLLMRLREKYQLDKVIAPARDEWTAQLLLKEWVHKSIPGGNPKVNAIHAGDILEQAARGETFYCTHYAITYVECALALGWQARKIAIDRRHGPEGLGSTHHGVAEVWSNQFRKWVVIDPQSNLHFEIQGLPLGAWEIRTEWLKDHGASVDHLVGVPPREVRKNPAILWWDRHGEDETAAYFWLYVEDHAVSSENELPAKLIFPQDDANRSLIWYQNDYESGRSQLHNGYLKDLFLPTRRIADVYWTVGITEVTLTGISKGAIALRLDSYCPNHIGYEVSFDGRSWKRVKDEKLLRWTLKSGWNSLRLHTLSRGGVVGPETSVLLFLV